MDVTNSLPSGYSDYDRGSVRIVALRLQLEELVSLLAGPARHVPADVSLGGRGGTRRVKLGGRILYLRKCLRGGLMRYLTRDLYLLRPARPLVELMVTEKARAAGCRVPVVAGVCVEEAGVFYRGWVVTEEIPGVVPWFRCYQEADNPERGRLLAAAGRAMRGLNAAGVYHADLNVHNLLVCADGEVAIVDFDKALAAAPDEVRRGERGRDRFWRSLHKVCDAVGEELDDAQRRWLERGYER